MTKYTLVYRKIHPRTNRFIGESITEKFEGSSDELKEHIRKMWSQGCCNVAAYKEGTTYRKKRRVKLKVDCRELNNVNNILKITENALSDLQFTFPKLPDIEAKYTVDCGNGFTAKFNALYSLKDTGGNYKYWVDSLLYLDDTVVCHLCLNESFQGEFSFDVGEEVVVVDVVPDIDAVKKSFEPKTVKFPKLLISVSILDDENEEDENDDVYYEY